MSVRHIRQPSPPWVQQLTLAECGRVFPEEELITWETWTKLLPEKVLPHLWSVGDEWISRTCNGLGLCATCGKKARTNRSWDANPMGCIAAYADAVRRARDPRERFRAECEMETVAEFIAAHRAGFDEMLRRNMSLGLLAGRGQAFE